MRRQGRSKLKEEGSFIDKLKDIGIIGIPLWIILFFFCCVGISECQDNQAKKPPTHHPYKLEENNHHSTFEQTTSGKKQPIEPVQSEENKLIDEIYNGDYYDYSDYYDDLDGEYSDIDYNDIRDYFED